MPRTTAINRRSKELQHELNRIMPILVKKYRPEKVILFGSMGSGCVKEWSDIDLAIIKRTKKALPERWDEIASLVHPQRAMDYIVYTPDEFASLKKKNHYFIREILKGKVLYER